MASNGPSAGPSLPPVLTVPEVAAYLRVTTKTVYGLVKQGRLRSFRVGRVMRFHRTDFETFIEESKDTKEGGEE